MGRVSWDDVEPGDVVDLRGSGEVIRDAFVTAVANKIASPWLEATYKRGSRKEYGTFYARNYDIYD